MSTPRPSWMRAALDLEPRLADVADYRWCERWVRLNVRRGRRRREALNRLDMMLMADCYDVKRPVVPWSER